MIEDMVSLNPRDNMTEPEKLMDKYIEKKWEKRIPVQPIIRFQEEYGDFINSSIQEYKEENPFGSKEDCINFVLKDCSEYIYEEMEFNCDRYIKELAALLYSDNN